MRTANNGCGEVLEEAGEKKEFGAVVNCYEITYFSDLNISKGTMHVLTHTKVDTECFPF